MTLTFNSFSKPVAVTVISSLLAVGLCMTACTKTNPTNPNPGGGSATARHPNFICQHQPGSSSLTGQFVVFDLDHEANKDKQFFVVSLLPAGAEFTDSAAVIQVPTSIDSLATGWPATIRSAAMGTTRNILIDAKNAVTYSVPNPWTYAPISNSTNLYRKLNDPAYAAGKAGQKPYGNHPFSTVYYPQTSYLPYNQTWRDITYYFKDGVFTDNTPGGGLQSLDTLFVGANAIPWRNIDQTVYVDYQHPSTALYYRKYYFFDWTNWKYYTVNETQQQKVYTTYPPVYYLRWEVKSYSLDRFCKWPQGWGKK